MSDRLFSLFLLSLALVYGAMALQLEVPFSYDPLGPKPVPLLLAGLLGLFSLVLLIRPRQINLPESSSLIRSGRLIAILVFYQTSWTILGFLLSTTISIYLVSRLFRCSWMQGLMVALIISVTCYGLFNFLLHVPLPLGDIFSYSRG